MAFTDRAAAWILLGAQGRSSKMAASQRGLPIAQLFPYDFQEGTRLLGAVLDVVLDE